MFRHLDRLAQTTRFQHLVDGPANRPDELLEMQLYEAGERLLSGFARILRFSSAVYEIQLLSGNADWGERFKTTRLHELDLDAPKASWRWRRWQHTFDFCAYTNSLLRTGRVDDGFDDDTASDAAIHAAYETHCFPPIAYNELSLANNPSTAFPFTQLRPATFVAPMLKAHFAQIGYRLESEWLDRLADGDAEHPLCLPYTGGTWRTELGDADARMVGELSLSTDDTTINQLRNIVPMDVVEDNSASEISSFSIPAGSASPNGWEAQTIQAWQPERAGRYRLSGRHKAVCTGTGSNGINALSVGLFDPSGGGSIVTELGGIIFSYDPFEVDHSFDYDVEILPEWIAQGYGVIVIALGTMNETYTVAGTRLRIERYNEVFEGNTFDLRASWPDLTVLELVKALTTMFNLRFETDANSKLVRMEPRDEFYHSTERHLDAMVDQATPIEQELLSAAYPKRVVLGYDNDSNDTALEDFEERTGVAFASGRLNNPNATVTGDDEQQVNSFSATTEQLHTDSGLSVPQCIENPDDLVFNTDFDPRILYVRPRRIDAFSIETQLAPTPCVGGSIPAGVQTTQLYQEAYFISDRLSLRFDDGPAGQPGLLQRYYAAEWANLQAARCLSLKLWQVHPSLNELLQFRKLLKLEDQRYYLQSVKNVRPGKPGLIDVAICRMDVPARSVDWPMVQTHCLQFTDPDEHILIPSPGDRLVTAQILSIGFWLRRLNGQGTAQTLMLQTDAGGNRFEVNFESSNALSVKYITASGFRGFTTVNAISDTNWHYYSFVKQDQDPQLWQLMIDGEYQVMANTGTPGLALPYALNGSLYINSDGANGAIAQMAKLHIQHSLVSLYEHRRRWNNGNGAGANIYRNTRLLLPMNQVSGEQVQCVAVPPQEAALVNKTASETDNGDDTWLPFVLP